MEGPNPASVMKMDQMKTHTHTQSHTWRQEYNFRHILISTIQRNKLQNYHKDTFNYYTVFSFILNSQFLPLSLTHTHTHTSKHTLSHSARLTETGCRQGEGRCDSCPAHLSAICGVYDWARAHILPSFSNKHSYALIQLQKCSHTHRLLLLLCETFCNIKDLVHRQTYVGAFQLLAAVILYFSYCRQNMFIHLPMLFDFSSLFVATICCLRT